MHPGVSAVTEGDCPICGMRLVRASAAPPAQRLPAARATLVLAPDAPEISRHDTAPASRRRLTRAVRSAAWVDDANAIVTRWDRGDGAPLPPGARARFVPAAAGPAIDVRLVGAVVLRSGPGAPAVEARFAAARPDDRRRAGEVGWVEIADVAVDALAVPAPAILESTDGPFVLVAAPDGRTFSKRPVRLERVVASEAFVRSGLDEHERVATMSPFSLDAARKLAADSSPPAPAPPPSPSDRP